MSWEPCVDGYDDEGLETVTSRDQKNTEKLVAEREKSEIRIKRNAHRDFMLKLISGLPSAFTTLCSEEPWIPYWFLNTLSVLSLEKIQNYNFYVDACMKYLLKRKPDQGYASAPQHKGHVILAYTAINSIALSQSEKAYATIDRRALYDWMMSLKQPNGSFRAEQGSEADSRSTYCAVSVASLLNMLTPEFVENVDVFLRSCQGYDGGFAPIPGMETHGGYGFTSLAALYLLGKLDTIDVDAAIAWCAMRQMPFEGGFNGRTHKLVDTCYTWWVGAMCRILADHKGIPPFWNEEALATYVLGVCQDAHDKGGLCDKPGVMPDMFHTMYGLSGLSAACRSYIKEKTGYELKEVDARHGITKDAAVKIKEYFAKTPFQ